MDVKIQIYVLEFQCSRFQKVKIALEHLENLLMEVNGLKSLVKKMMESGNPSDSSFVEKLKNEKYCMHICNVHFKKSDIIKTNKKSTLKFGALPEKYLSHNIALSKTSPQAKKEKRDSSCPSFSQLLVPRNNIGLNERVHDEQISNTFSNAVISGTSGGEVAYVRKDYAQQQQLNSKPRHCSLDELKRVDSESNEKVKWQMMEHSSTCNEEA